MFHVTLTPEDQGQMSSNIFLVNAFFLKPIDLATANFAGSYVA